MPCGTSVEPVLIARRLARSVSRQRGCSSRAWMVEGTSHRQRRPVFRDRAQRVLRREPRMQRHGGAQLQRRYRLDVEAADMEQRQHRQHVILRRHRVQVLAHHCVGQQGLLCEYGALGPSRCARGVDDQQRRAPIDIRFAAVAAIGSHQVGQRDATVGRMIQANNLRLRGCDRARERLGHEQCAHIGVGQDELQFRHRKPPVQRHQHRAQPRAGVEQHQVVGMVHRQHRDAVAATHAQLRFQRARKCSDALGEGRVAPCLTGKAQRRLVGCEGGVAIDHVGKVHVSVSPLLYSAPWPIRSRQTSAVHGAIRDPQRLSR